MTENKPTEKRKVFPKRFVDRKDKMSIMKNAGGFLKRGHEHIPAWMVKAFFLMQLGFIGIMLFFAAKVLDMQQQKTEIVSVIQYMLLCFVVVTSYSMYIVTKLKDTLHATEFMGLFLAKSLESYSSCYCILTKEGKIVYYNDSFARQFMLSNDDENLTYAELLDQSYFDAKNMQKVKDALEKTKETHFTVMSSVGGSQMMRNIRIVPLSRPEGLFAIKVISIDVLKG